MFSKGSTKEEDATGATETKGKLEPLPQRPRSGKPGMPSIVSEGLHVTGNLISDGDVQIDGTIEGDVKGRNLTVGVNGNVLGKVIGIEVVVSGGVAGEINGGSVTLARTAKVNGDIIHDTLAIEAGAEFEGRCKRGAITGQAAAKPSGKTASSSNQNETRKQVFQRLSTPEEENTKKSAQSGA